MNSEYGFSDSIVIPGVSKEKEREKRRKISIKSIEEERRTVIRHGQRIHSKRESSRKSFLSFCVLFFVTQPCKMHKPIVFIGIS
jgi:hypothetical protein